MPVLVASRPSLLGRLVSRWMFSRLARIVSDVWKNSNTNFASASAYGNDGMDPSVNLPTPMTRTWISRSVGTACCPGLAADSAGAPVA